MLRGSVTTLSECIRVPRRYLLPCTSEIRLNEAWRVIAVSTELETFMVRLCFRPFSSLSYIYARAKDSDVNVQLALQELVVE